MEIGSIARRCGGRDGAICYMLEPGIVELTEPLMFAGDAISLSGMCQDGELVSILRRGKRPDGELYDGPLLLIQGQNDVILNDLIVDGARFETGPAGLVDHRHPLDHDRRSPEFPCGKRLPAPQCWSPTSFNSSMSPDITIMMSSGIVLKNVEVRNAVRIGVAVSRECSDVRFERVDVRRSGDYGVWMGTGSPETPPLPLPPSILSMLPSGVVFTDCFFEGCGGSAVHIEGMKVSFSDTLFLGNHCDFPYDDEGGQIVIDYKAKNIYFDSCIVMAGTQVERRSYAQDLGTGQWSLVTRLLGAVGIEASGTDLKFHNMVIAGNSREAIQLIGASDVRISGARSRLFGNNLARQRYPQYAIDGGAITNVSITTLPSLSAVNSFSRDIAFCGGICENGVAVWSNGAVPCLKIDGIKVQNCDMSGALHSGVWIGSNPDGSSLEGEGWSL